MKTEEGRQKLFAELGWQIDAFTDTEKGAIELLATGPGGSSGLVKTIADAVDQIETVADAAGEMDFDMVSESVKHIQQAIATIRSLETLVTSTAPDLGKDILHYYLLEAVKQFDYRVYTGLKFLGIVVKGEEENVYVALAPADSSVDAAAINSHEVSGSDQKLLRVNNTIEYVKFEKLIELAEDPVDYLQKQFIEPYNFETVAGIEAAVKVIFPLVARFLVGMGFYVSFGRSNGVDEENAPPLEWHSGSGLTQAEKDAIENRLKRTLTFWKEANSGDVEGTLGASVFVNAEGEDDVPDDAPGVVLIPFAEGDYSRIDGNLLTEVSASAESTQIQINKNGVHFDPGVLSEFSLNVLLSSLIDADAVLGMGTQISMDGCSLLLFAGKKPASGGAIVSNDFGGILSLTNVKVVYKPGGDSFLAKFMPGSGLSTSFNLKLSWTKKKGFSFNGAPKLTATLPLTIGDSSGGFFSVKDIKFGLKKAGENQFRVFASSSLGLNFNSFKLAVDNLGIHTSLDFGHANPNLGIADLRIGFLPPEGIGLSIETASVVGAGYLFLDPENHKYAGIANLKIQNTINVTAYGLLNTQLPSGRPGFSFLLSITAKFAPALQLGLGFTLSGIGGLVGINRGANLDVLREGVKNGLIDRILFPEVSIKDFLPFLNQVDQAFPVDEHRNVFGLMTELNWGSPVIIKLKVGFIIVVPDPIDIAVLGVLSIEQPPKEKAKPVLILKATFIGIYQTRERFISFDASLAGSSILNYTIAGDIVVRVQLGSGTVSADFVYSAGGFHPVYMAPATLKLPANIERLSLRISSSENFRLTFQSYFAVTPNTLQFGSRVDLMVKLGKFRVDGFASFDTFIVFDPFSLQAKLAAELAVMNDRKKLMSLRMDGQLTGPGPWNVKGSISFQIWFVKIKANIDQSFGKKIDKSLPPNYAVVEDFVREMAKRMVGARANYEVVNPPSNNKVVSFAKTTSALVPDGKINFNQTALPLNAALYKTADGIPFLRPITFSIPEWKLKTRIGNVPTTIPHGRIPYNEITKVGDKPNKSYFVASMFTKDTNAQSLAAKNAYEPMTTGYLLDFPGGDVREMRTSAAYQETDLSYEQEFYGPAGTTIDHPFESSTLSADSSVTEALLRSSPGVDNSYSALNKKVEFVGASRAAVAKRYYIADTRTMDVLAAHTDGFSNYLEAKGALSAIKAQGNSKKLMVYTEAELAA